MVVNWDISQQNCFISTEIPPLLHILLCFWLFLFSVSICCGNKGLYGLQRSVVLLGTIQSSGDWFACSSSPWGLSRFFHMDMGLCLISRSFHSITVREEKAQAIWWRLFRMYRLRIPQGLVKALETFGIVKEAMDWGGRKVACLLFQEQLHFTKLSEEIQHKVRHACSHHLSQLFELELTIITVATDG